MTAAIASRAVFAGLALGVRFDPLTAMIGSAVAAVAFAVAGRRGRLIPWWVLVAAVAWAFGDGVAVAARASAIAAHAPSLLGAGAPQAASWLMLAAWAVSGLAVGYLLPAAVGGEVGKRVTFGTGWLAAAAIAVTVCFAFIQLAEPAAVFFARMAG